MITVPFRKSFLKNAVGLILLLAFYTLCGQGNALEAYQIALGPQTHLNNGSSFKPSYVSRTEHPFFLDPQFTKGSVTYDKVFYNNAKLLFNLSTNELLLKDSVSGKTMRLIEDNISNFSIHNHTFLKVQSIPDLENGFYDILIEGPCSILIRRDKSLQYIKRDGRIKNIYQTRNRIFLRINDMVVPVTSKASLLESFGSNMVGVKNGLKNVQVKFSGDKEKYCVEAARIFNELISR
ncbi:MAG: hypothetical protein FJZ78_08995 [Bacteroidetes bacterium]|nr:hypothetical protein [Bacteroidota bacterium]